MATHNPVLSRTAFDSHAATSGETMTLGGTMRKTFGLLALVAAGMLYTWFGMPGIGLEMTQVYPLAIGSTVVALGLYFLIMFRPQYAPVAAPVYSAVQGVVLGVITIIFNARYPGIAVQAGLLTVATLGVMLVAYRTRVIRVTEKLRSIVISCTAAIFVFYLIAFGMSLFGLRIPFLHEGGVIGIGFSLFVTGLAAFNLLLDFDTIEAGIGSAPEEFEWMAAFGLVVTLIWLYMEMLRLLGKLRR
jgi:uncharacterized YccA/Bax inhibitor family protein